MLSCPKLTVNISLRSAHPTSHQPHLTALLPIFSAVEELKVRGHLQILAHLSLVLLASADLLPQMAVLHFEDEEEEEQETEEGEGG